MKIPTRKQFVTLAAGGSARRTKGKNILGGDLYLNTLGCGLAEGYSLADICRFYAISNGCRRDQKKFGPADKEVLDRAYHYFVCDLVQLTAAYFLATRELSRTR